jgi:hypothetical protein
MYNLPAPESISCDRVSDRGRHPKPSTTPRDTSITGDATPPDGRTLWLSYSANFTNGYLNTRFKSSPDGSRYAMCLQEVKLRD